MDRFVYALFKAYYISNRLEIPDLEKREIAIEPLTGGGMRRHLAAQSEKALRELLARSVPRHLYYSTALYERPDEPDMDAKGWLGADLVFDIDADHLPDCGEGSPMLRCLEKAIAEATRLVDALRDELGIESVRLFFSGRRGFHVHVENDEVRGLGPRERRVLVELLTATGLDSARFEVRVGRKRSFAWELAEAGSLRRIKSGNPAIRIDEVVTPDVHRLIRAPGSIHGKTGLRVVELSLSDLEKGPEHVIRKAQWHKGRLKIVLTNKPPSTAILDEVGGEVGSVVELDFHDALYLILNGYAQLYEGETRRVAKSGGIHRLATRPTG